MARQAPTIARHLQRIEERLATLQTARAEMARWTCHFRLQAHDDRIRKTVAIRDRLQLELESALRATPAAPKYIDLSGQQFGCYVALRPATRDELPYETTHTFWVVRCRHCDAIRVVDGNRLRKLRDIGELCPACPNHRRAATTDPRSGHYIDTRADRAGGAP